MLKGHTLPWVHILPKKRSTLGKSQRALRKDSKVSVGTDSESHQLEAQLVSKLNYCKSGGLLAILPGLRLALL
eukprot:870107-Pelagomonas_calceolata.AAC.1